MTNDPLFDADPWAAGAALLPRVAISPALADTSLPVVAQASPAHTATELPAGTPAAICAANVSKAARRLRRHKRSAILHSKVASDHLWRQIPSLPETAAPLVPKPTHNYAAQPVPDATPNTAVTLDVLRDELKLFGEALIFVLNEKTAEHHVQKYERQDFQQDEHDEHKYEHQQYEHQEHEQPLVSRVLDWFAKPIFSWNAGAAEFMPKSEDTAEHKKQAEVVQSYESNVDATDSGLSRGQVKALIEDTMRKGVTVAAEKYSNAIQDLSEEMKTLRATPLNAAVQNAAVQNNELFDKLYEVLAADNFTKEMAKVLYRTPHEADCKCDYCYSRWQKMQDEEYAKLTDDELSALIDKAPHHRETCCCEKCFAACRAAQEFSLRQCGPEWEAGSEGSYNSDDARQDLEAYKRLR